MRIFKLFSLALLMTFVQSVNAELHTFTLQHRQATDLIPVIQPLLQPTTGISGQGFELFIEGDEKEKNNVTQILQQLDVAQTQYEVELRILDLSMSANQLSKNDIALPNNNANRQKNAPVKVLTYQSRVSDPKNHLYHITVIENAQAFVATGENFPNNQLQNNYGSFIPTTGRTQLNNGFYLIVSRQGDQQVLISLSAQQQQRQSQYGSSVTSSTTSTRIRTSLGQWVLVASTEKKSKQFQSGKNVSISPSYKSYSTNQSKNQSRWYYMRVRAKQD